MKIRLSFVLMLLMLTFISGGSIAQEETTEAPLLQMLRLVPNNAIARSSTVGFSDFKAAELARPAIAGIESWQDYEAIKASEDSLKAGLWTNSIPMMGAANFANYLFAAAPDLPEVMGFDVFDIEQALTFGEPPTFADLIKGDFDETAIDTALTGQGFVRSELNGFPLWCAEAGCDAGDRMNLENRNLANLFGGSLGLQQPTVLADDVLYSSRSEDLMTWIAEAYTGEEESLADDEHYRTAANILIAQQDAYLRQAYFISPLMIDGFNPAAILGEQATAEMIQAQIEEMEAYAAKLPPYQLLVMGDTSTTETQYATLILVYNSEADAQTALTVVPERIADYTSFVTKRTLTEMIEIRELTQAEPALIADETTGKFAAVFTFEYPAPPDTRDDAGLIYQTGVNYRWLVSMLWQRDLGWLATSIN